MPLGASRIPCELGLVPHHAIPHLPLREGSLFLKLPFHFLLTEEVLMWGTRPVALKGPSVPVGLLPNLINCLALFQSITPVVEGSSPTCFQ